MPDVAYSTRAGTRAMAQYVQDPQSLPYASFMRSLSAISPASAVSQREQLAEDEDASSSATGERLVRVPLEELRRRESKT